MDQIPCQRWRHGRDSYRPSGETIDTGRHEVRVIDEKTAKAAVLDWHYARSYPVAGVGAGLFRKMPFRQEELAGVAVFSVPMNPRSIPKHTGVSADHGIELGRFVLTDEVEGNGEKFFLARALRLLKETLPEIRAVLSYSDPVPRQLNDIVIKNGHVGVIYSASNFVHLGRSGAETLLISRRDGRVVSRRALSKIRNNETGRDYALRQLRDLGAPALLAGEAAKDYLDRVLHSDAFLKFRHPGNYVYAMALGDRKERRLMTAAMAPSPPIRKRRTLPAACKTTAPRAHSRNQDVSPEFRCRRIAPESRTARRAARPPEVAPAAPAEDH
jgi:hypothetical protein